MRAKTVVLLLVCAAALWGQERGPLAGPSPGPSGPTRASDPVLGPGSHRPGDLLPPTAPREPLEYRTFDTGFLTAPVLQQRLDAGLPLIPVYRWEDDKREPGWDQPTLAMDVLADTIRSSIDPEGWDLEGHGLTFTDESLVVRSTPEVLAKIARYLQYLERVFLAPSTVEVYLVPGDRAGGGSVLLSAEEADRLLAEVNPPLAGQVHLLPGRLGRLRTGNLVSFVADYDVEVAQKAKIADPSIRTLHDGLDLGLSFERLPTGQLLVHVAGRSSRLQTLRLMDTNSSGVGRLQLPVMDSNVFAATGVLNSGGALLAGTSRQGADAFYLFRFRGGQVDQGGPEEGATVIPAGAAGLPQQTLGSMPFGLPEASGDEGEGAMLWEAAGDGEPRVLLFMDAFMEMVVETVDPAGWAEDVHRSITATERHLLVQAPPEVVRQIAEAASRLCQESLLVASLEFRVGHLPSAQLQAASDPRTDLAALAGMLEFRGLVGAVMGDDFRLVVGREHAYLKDHDVEIAQESQIADPVVATVFEGLALQGRLSRTATGALALRAELVHQGFVGEVVPVDANADHIGLVETPRCSTTHVNIHETLRDGQWALLHLARRPGQGEGLVVLARARF